MLERKRIDCLLVGQTPPPFHGQAIVTGMLFEHRWSKVNVALLRMAYSASIDAVGRFGFKKIFHLFYLIFKTWQIAAFQSPRVLYYLPSSPHKIPLIRDMVYLSAVRWLFPKVVFHYHAGGLADYVDGLGILKPLAKWVYGNVDVSIELSEGEDSPSDYFKAKEKVIVPNGLDVPDLKQVKCAASDRFNVLFIGALVEGKGISNIVQTAFFLKKEGFNVHFTIVGGWGSEEYMNLVYTDIRKKGLSKLITFTGVLTGDKKWSMFASADCFFFPSHYASESFPLVLIEAMACGLPVISTKWRGIPKLVHRSEAAILCNIKCPVEYAEKIKELIVNVEMRKRMSAAARLFYEKNYTKKIFLDKIEETFAQMVDSV